MTEPRKSGPFFRRAAAGAAVIAAVVAAGAVALYVKDVRSGNARTDEIALDAPECKGAIERASVINAAATGEVAAMRAADREMSLAGLRFAGPGGEQVRLGDFKDKLLLVNIWATWCVPCREEIPALDRLQAMKGSKDFQVVAVNIDTGDADKPTAFLRKAKADNLAPYRDSSLGIFNKLKAQGLAFGLPVTLLVDGKNCLLASMNGPANWASEDAGRLIDAALAASSS